MKTRIYISGINLVLSSDEIIELRKEYIGRNKHHRSFKIRGKIFTGLTDKEVEESDMITMSKKESMDYFPEMTRKILEENFSLVDINEIEKNLKKKIYEHNRENIRKIMRWSNSSENCYQTMIIETIPENDSPVFLIIPSVFVKKMSVSASVDEGTGEFELLLYQRFNANESVVEVYKGDKGASSPTPRNVTKNNVIVTDNNTPSEYVPDEQVEKNSANIGLITDNEEKYEIIMTFNISLGKLTVVTPDKTFEAKATSGRGKYLNNPSLESQQAKNEGVLPVGEYLIKPSDLSDPNLVIDFIRNLPIVGADWGDWRIRLHHKEGKQFNRDNFFLHGGNILGSAGCVDIGGGILGNKTTNKVKEIIKSSKKDILFKVIEGENND